MIAELRRLTLGLSVAVLMGVVAMPRYSYAAPMFRSPDVYGTVRSAHGVSTSDVDGDGALDLFACARNADSLWIFRNNHEGRFSPLGSYGTGVQPTGVATGDLNGDGLPDWSTANGDGSFSVGLADPGGGYTVRTTKVATHLVSMAIADLDGDGYPDLVATDGFGALLFMWNDGIGGFGTVTFISGMLAYPVATAIADYDNDGIPDVAVAGGATHIYLYRGLGGRRFEEIDSPTIDGHNGIAALDWDGDGKMDVVVSDAIVNMASICRGLGDGRFAEVARVPVGFQPSSVAAADFDGDGNVDAAVATYGETSVALLMNDGHGGVREVLHEECGGYPRTFTASDLDGNGYPDLVVSLPSESEVAVLLNAHGPATAVEIGDIASTFDRGVAEIEWSLPGGAGDVAGVERRDESSDWTRLAGTVSIQRDVVSVRDATVVMGRRYGYRLRMSDGLHLGETWLTAVTGQDDEIRLRAFPNPSGGTFRIALLGARGSWTYEVMDYMGRRVRSGTIEGGVKAEATDRRLPPGEYVVTARSGSKVLHTKVVVRQ